MTSLYVEVVCCVSALCWLVEVQVVQVVQPFASHYPLAYILDE